MFAVMRFGKSFTAMQCALQTGCEKVLIVSAKADVKSEWKKTVEMPECFKEFSFVCDDDLKAERTLDSFLAGEAPGREGRHKIAVFLTLQNLTNKTTDEDGNVINIKKRLEPVFEMEYDLIIVDETHFGAWAGKFGAPLSDEKITAEEDSDTVKDDRKDYNNFVEKINSKLKCKNKLHLSGTPYNLLYDNVFADNQIISTCRFKDILDAKQKWDEDHLDKIAMGEINEETGEPYQEYDNPYFGFPKMLRFAFNLPQSAREEIRRLKGLGYNISLSDLFEIDTEKKAFAHEGEVLKLLKVIDGAESDDDVLGFLDVPVIKEHSVCKHIVMVLPSKTSCDLMQELLENNKKSFRNLGEYEIANIAGNKSNPDVTTIKRKIADFERDGKKTISLTSSLIDSSTPTHSSVAQLRKHELRW